MALGLIFWVSCISLPFDSNGGSPTIKGYGHRYGYMYPNKAEPRDLVDDGDDDILTSDQGNQQAADNQQAGFVYKSYNKRSTKQQQTQQKQANPQIAPKIEGLVNGETRQWGLVNLNEPLLFP